MTRGRSIQKVLLYACVVAGLLAAASALTHVRDIVVEDVGALSRIDLSKHIAYITCEGVN